MRNAKELKKELKEKASKDPDNYYATSVLKKDGFFRGQCEKCGTYFWSTDKSRKICGDSMCVDGFTFFEENPSSKKMSYVEVWQEFSKMFKSLGYTPIKRYPTVARWNPTMEFTIASIAAFQPFVISGEVEPPANPLVIPQFCVRFGDIENIGITASHQTGFVMIGQHMFVPKEEWNQDRVFSDIKKWLNEGLGINDKEITFHEDAWAGGGNAGPCMEYFVRGLELGNQVYMLYEQTDEDKLVDLKLKVLDMGMGHERNAWFTQCTPTQHQAIYPKVVKKLLERTELKIDEELFMRFVPLSGKLNIDEVEDINEAWKGVAKILDMDVDTLKEKILPISGIFSIADHARTLLFTLSDGALPSNVGGGYNLRMLIRRALSFINKYKWDIRLAEVCRWHAEELKPIFPELSNNLDNVEKILSVERKKYETTKEKTGQIVKRIINEDITEEKLLQLYDSNGIPPELIIKEAKKLGKEVKMPDNFFGKVGELHEKKAQAHQTKKDFSLNLDGLLETKANYFGDYTKSEFNAKVLKVIENKVVLDQTLFYPTSGGQIHDKGTINSIKVIDVFKQGAYIVHVMEKEVSWKEKDVVIGKVEKNRRKQLAQHHTATHIVNYAARKVLGNHVNQAGAKKTKEKAHLDITHYDTINEDELKKIEGISNEVIKEDIEIKTGFYPRRIAEDKYGMDIYQGGAVPGKEIRIVEIPNVDIEACGGTHLNKTSEVGTIKILKTTKIQDGIVRITFSAGNAAENVNQEEGSLLSDAAKLLNVKEAQVPARAQELFNLWKRAVKKKKIKTLEELELKSIEEFEGNALAKTAEILKTQPEHIINTIKRFLNEIEEYKDKLE